MVEYQRGSSDISQSNEARVPIGDRQEQAGRAPAGGNVHLLDGVLRSCLVDW